MCALAPVVVCALSDAVTSRGAAVRENQARNTTGPCISELRIGSTRANPDVIMQRTDRKLLFCPVPHFLSLSHLFLTPWVGLPGPRLSKWRSLSLFYPG